MFAAIGGVERMQVAGNCRRRAKSPGPDTREESVNVVWNLNISKSLRTLEAGMAARSGSPERPRHGIIYLLPVACSVRYWRASRTTL